MIAQATMPSARLLPAARAVKQWGESLFPAWARTDVGCSQDSHELLLPDTADSSSTLEPIRV